MIKALCFTPVYAENERKVSLPATKIVREESSARPFLGCF